jgi:signal transduction histidine kinase
MNVIVGFSNVLLQTTLHQDQTACIRAVKELGNALLILINNIVDIKKLDARIMAFKNISFN